ncbi:hypothetical protein [Cerasicoccus arenae]|uniref:hypothetical protein n=1 Tax=Cerasicoccus arenae TaxID=424488 RepID=UPI00167B83DA|nr:hypothetical protein [Cerasicoccus arenae]MBK1858617.1 hypothetical protein [Cerasicoccus arenae]
MRPHCTLFLIGAAALLAACQPRTQTPPPATELIGGPCKYDSTSAVAVVSDSDDEQVRFLINGRVTSYSRSDLPDFDYQSGARFSVVEKRITQGTCTPYILEVVGPTTMPPPASQTTKWHQPNPDLM